VHVPYKGSGPSIADLIGGQIQFTFDTPPATLGQVSGGRLNAIAVATKERLPNAPDIPTMSEAGLPGLIGGTWFGLLVPAKTPQPIVDRLNKETVAALTSPALRKSFEDRGVMPSPTSAQEFGSFIQSEVAKWKTLAEKVGIVAE
jgi:tripartite-type tricarboxylate transporter receptor subunit TctC